MPLKNCAVCGDEFMARLSVYKTCGTVCRNRLIAAEKEAKHTVTQPCIVCGKEFSNTGKQKHRKTCSVACGHVLQGRSSQNQIVRNCLTCGNEFSAEASRDAKYCSKACMYARNDTSRPCEVCNTLFRSPPSQMHVRTCSTECGGKIRENSRVMMPCKECGTAFEVEACHQERRSFCSHTCKHENEETKARKVAQMTGENNPGWQGGITFRVISANGKTYARQSPAKENAKGNRRRAAQLQATPAWASPALILAFYEEAYQLSIQTGIVYHVDHMVPLQSKHVCGLHTHDNLCVMVGSDNISKSNRHWPDKP